MITKDKGKYKSNKRYDIGDIVWIDKGLWQCIGTIRLTENGSKPVITIETESTKQIDKK